MKNKVKNPFIPVCIWMMLAVLATVEGPALSQDSSTLPVGRAHMEGVELYREGKLEEAANRFEYELRTNPANTRAMLFLAITDQKLGQWEEAVKNWQAYLATQPPQREAAFIERQLEYSRRQLALSGVDEDDGQFPLAVAKPPSEKLSREDFDGLAEDEAKIFTEITSHFRVQARNVRLAKLIAEEAEFALERITRQLLRQEAYPHTVDIYVWRDPTEMREQGIIPEWGSAGFTVTKKEGGETVRRIDLCQLTAEGKFDHDLFPRALPHELCHVVISEFFGNRDCPLWLHEGLARLAEAGEVNRHEETMVRFLREGQEIPLRELFAMKRYEPERTSLFYAESASVTKYLFARLSDAQVASFLDHIKEGQDPIRALERTLVLATVPDRAEKLQAAWKKSLLAAKG
jgi:hypothetical protein